MTIDWITVAAQIVNFLVLVWLMKRFLYRPILDGIDAREAEISNRMQQAVLAKDQSQAAVTEYQNKAQALSAQQEALSETIRVAAEKQRDTLLAEADQKMQADQLNWQSQREEDARQFSAQLHRAGATTLLALLRKALVDLADETLEHRMAHHLIQQLGPMASDLQNAAGEATLAVVISHEPLTPPTQADLRQELESLFDDVVVRFDTDPEQSFGLMVRMGGAELAWSIESYISELDTIIGAKLAADVQHKAAVHAH